MAHLLIVEDDLVAQRSLIRALQTHTCVAACNGLEALKCLDLQTFDLIISDVDMPIMNGIDFYRHICRAFPNVKLIFRTGSNFPDLGALGVPILRKEWPLPKVLYAVTSHLSGVLEGDGQSETLPQVGGG